MAKYRMCPSCKTKNPLNLLECQSCGYDLQFEKTLDDSIEQTADTQITDDERITSGLRMVRKCECGENNPVQARVCLKCGEDISDITPTEENEDVVEDAPRYILCSIDGEYAYQFDKNLVVVGRECEMHEYLESKRFVSRKHAEFLLENDVLYIKNHSLTNHTYVNNEMIPQDKYVSLKEGDEIGLGGKIVNESRQDEAAYFTVRISSCCM